MRPEENESNARSHPSFGQMRFSPSALPPTKFSDAGHDDDDGYWMCSGSRKRAAREMGADFGAARVAVTRPCLPAFARSAALGAHKLLCRSSR